MVYNIILNFVYTFRSLYFKLYINNFFKDIK